MNSFLSEYQIRVDQERREWRRYNLHRTVKNQNLFIDVKNRTICVLSENQLTKQAKRLVSEFHYQVQFDMF